MELSSSELELELNCVRDLVPESELEWKILRLSELELNCKNAIDPRSDAQTISGRFLN